MRASEKNFVLPVSIKNAATINTSLVVEIFCKKPISDEIKTK
ncbi:hypothetical protein MNB_SUP05-10-122 [hydrothermal vent metagenome]|uniref:Uncharacterized protein n=1 Tax=hydrothermal vent metagenome TaxID=652676 RepID=A0A1W1DV08_9ZZZZ